MEAEGQIQDKVVINNYDSHIPKSADEFIAFASKLKITPQQLKSGDLTGLNIDPATKNVIVPAELLPEQGELLFNLFTHNKDLSNPRTQELGKKINLETMERILSDAAFKVVDRDKQTIMHSLIFTSPMPTERLLSQDRLLRLIERATPEQLELKNKNDDTILDIMLLYYPYKKPDPEKPVSDLERRDNVIKAENYEIIKAVANKVNINSLKKYKKNLDPRYKIIEEVIKDRRESGKAHESLKSSRPEPRSSWVGESTEPVFAGRF